MVTIAYTRRFCIVAGFLIISPCIALAAPFYENKMLTVMINFAPGGPTDIEGRLLARYLAKHIEGKPNVIAQNKPGAGGMIGTNFLGRIAPKDGTFMGYLTSAAWPAVSNPERFEVNFKDYEFVAYQPGTSVYYVRTDVAPGLKSATDLASAKGIIAGGLERANAKDLGIRMTLDLLGTPYKYVTGYGSNQPARMAFERGEINFFVESPPAYRGVVEPGMVKSGTAIPVFYDTVFDGEIFSEPKQVAGLGILPFHELYKKVKGEMPKGPLWDAYLAVTTLRGTMQRIAALPPGSPQEAVTALRAAVQRLNDDPAYAADAMKAMGFVPDYEAKPNTNDQVRRAISIDPQIKKFVDDYLEK